MRVWRWLRNMAKRYGWDALLFWLITGLAVIGTAGAVATDLSGIYEVPILVIGGLILMYLCTLPFWVQKLRDVRTLRPIIVRDQIDSDNDVKQRLKNYKPRKVDILGFSGYAIQDIMRELSKIEGCHIRLLLCLPSKMGTYDDGEMHPNRLKTVLFEFDRLANEDRRSRYGELEIKFYSTTPSARGLQFDHQFASIGWYLYSLNDQGKEQIRGDNKPMINVTLLESPMIVDEFCQHFDNLWNRSDSLDKVRQKFPDFDLPQVSQVPKRARGEQ